MTEADPILTVASRRIPDRIWLPGLVAGLLALVFVGGLLARADGDVSLLVHAAPPWSDAGGAGARGSLTVQPDVDDGFDGQFFYRLGVAPWSSAETEGGVTNDLPALRNARWGYGALAYVASAGDPDLVPWALVGLNVLAAAAVGTIGGALARSSGRHAAWGLLFALWPGFAYSLSLDTSELVASAFLLGALLAVRRRRWAGAVLLFTAAVLTRDTTASVAFGIAAYGAWSWVQACRPSRPSAEEPASDAHLATSRAEARAGLARRDAVRLATAGALPLVAFAGWQLVQLARFDDLPLSSSNANNQAGPLTGLVDQLGTLLPPSGGAEAFRLVSVVGLLALLGAAGWCARSAPAAARAERLAWLVSLAVVVRLNAYLWSGATAFMRAATEAGVLSIALVVAAARPRLLALVGSGLAALWLLTAVAQLGKLG